MDAHQIVPKGAKGTLLILLCLDGPFRDQNPHGEVGLQGLGGDRKISLCHPVGIEVLEIQ